MYPSLAALAEPTLARMGDVRRGVLVPTITVLGREGWWVDAGSQAGYCARAATSERAAIWLAVLIVASVLFGGLAWLLT